MQPSSHMRAQSGRISAASAVCFRYSVNTGDNPSESRRHPSVDFRPSNKVPLRRHTCRIISVRDAGIMAAE